MKISSLKVLTDENVSPLIVSFLRKKNIDVADVKEKGWQGTEDKYLMKIAYTEERFIVTHDSDFGTLAINEGVPCYGIIYMRLKNLGLSNVINVLEKLFVIDQDITEGADSEMLDNGVILRYKEDELVGRRKYPW